MKYKVITLLQFSYKPINHCNPATLFLFSLRNIIQTSNREMYFISYLLCVVPTRRFKIYRETSYFAHNVLSSGDFRKKYLHSTLIL